MKGRKAAYVVGSCGYGKFNSLTVSEFLEVANIAVSGHTNILNGYAATLSDVNKTASCLNEAYDNCDPFANSSSVLASKDDGSSMAASSEPAQKTDDSQ